MNSHFFLWMFPIVPLTSLTTGWIDVIGWRYTQECVRLSLLALLAGAVEYTDCISAEGWDALRNECPRYDTKKSDGEVPVLLKLWGMRSTPSLPSLPGPLQAGVVTPDRFLSMGKIELKCGFESLLFLHLNCVFMLNWITWNRTILIFKLCTYAKLNCLK